jgi:hypothetical protein
MSEQDLHGLTLEQFDGRELEAACQSVVATSPHAALDLSAAQAFAASAPDALLELPAWDAPRMALPEDMVPAWLLAYNAVNFCYWPDSGPRWAAVVDDDVVGADDEALGIMAAFAEAIRCGVPLDDGRWLTTLDASSLDALLPTAPGHGELPMAEARAAGLRELGRAYAEYGGATGLVAHADGDGAALVEVLVDALPSWRDERICAGTRLRYRKRAQLCVAMLHGRLGGESYGALSNLDKLSAFADYRLPQILRGRGVLRLSDALADRIARGELLEVGSAEECALRAGAVAGAAAVAAALEALGRPSQPLVVDHLLWRSAVAEQHVLPPFHRTRTTDY